jgi:hypothetical protein
VGAFCFYYFFLAVVVVRYETKATARWALLFIVRAFFDDTIAVAVWTGFHFADPKNSRRSLISHASGAFRAHEAPSAGRRREAAVSGNGRIPQLPQ